jgi:hypothetical protein
MNDLNGLTSWIAPAVSIISVCFAGAVWWTSHEKLRLDLYNRRFDVYSRTLDFYHALLGWQPTELEKATTSLNDSPELGNTQKAFIKASREAQLLFDDTSEIQKQLEQMHEDTIWWIGYKRDCAGKPFDPPTVISMNNEFTERRKRVDNSLWHIESGLSAYLDFHRFSLWGSIHRRKWFYRAKRKPAEIQS